MDKILILANDSEGLYAFRFELIKELIRQDFEVCFSVPQSNDDQNVRHMIDAGAKHIQTHMNRRGVNPLEDLKLIKSYKRLIKDINPNVILTYTIKPNIYGNYAAQKYNKPVIMNITGLGSSLVVGNLKYIIRKMYKYACSKAKIIFFQNKGNYDFFIDNNIANGAKARVIPGSGINIEKFAPMEKTKDDSTIRFLFIGRIMKEKGIEEYLQAAKSISEEYENTEFQILGSFEEESYRDKILNMKNEKIKYLGVSSDVRNEIKEVDCVINPSYHEGMSNVLLEGAAMGKPLIASNIPGCKEAIEEGYNGFLFSPKSAKSLENRLIDFLELEFKERELMGKNSRRKVEMEFGRNLVISEYMKAISNILEKGDNNEPVSVY